VTVVRARPQRLRRVCWLSAAAIVAVFVAFGGMLNGRPGSGMVFHAGDRLAVGGIGVVAALAVLSLTRPRVEADEHRIRIRNVLGSYDLPWEVVSAVRFDATSPWVVLDLADDDEVAVMAVQAVDKQYAVEAVTGLRSLLAASRA
jgi:hypothetical protein